MAWLKQMNLPGLFLVMGLVLESRLYFPNTSFSCMLFKVCKYVCITDDKLNLECFLQFGTEFDFCVKDGGTCLCTMVI